MRKIIVILAFALLAFLLYTAVLWPLLKSAIAVAKQSVAYDISNPKYINY